MAVQGAVRRPARSLRLGVILVLLVLTLTSVEVLGRPAPVAAAVPTGFTEVTAFSGLVNPTAVRFAPNGQVFVAEKRGTVKVFDGLGDTTATQIADLRTEVYNFWDRGLLGLAVDPQYPTRPYVYVLYTFDGPIGGTAPRWGTAGADSDPCPSPPGPTDDGCVVSGKLARLTVTTTGSTKQDLIHDWCQQYPSHSIGDLVFGRDGALYASGGDGASFNWVDYGQDGNPVNPCGDPPGGVLTPPAAEGGALRAQDLRTPADPVTLDGTVIRVSPDTGAAMADNPNAGATDANAKRIVAYGLRNPFRLTTRPGTDEVWLGDVGWSTYEEVNRIVSPRTAVTNFGWPCYEGNDRQPGYDGANLGICENLYAAATADTKPYFPYRHGQPVSATDNCNVTRGSSSSGMSFSFYSGGPYPAEYDGALFFADYSRNCVWVMTKGTDGLPDKLKVRPFVTNAAGPVDLELSPQGELFYADLNGGTIRRIVYGGSGPTSCPDGHYLAQYYADKTLSGTPAVTTCELPPLNHDWGTGAPTGVGPDNFSARWSGTFAFPTATTYTFTAVSDDGIRVWVDGVLLIDQWRDQAATTFTASRSLSAGPHQVRVEWFETGGAAVARLDWAPAVANEPPQPVISGPAAGSTWAVGETIAFSGSATDPEDGVLPAGALSWAIVLMHCPADCHEHAVSSFTGASGSIAGPDHELPAHLEARLTATDSAGNRATVTRRLDPRTVAITVASQPTGLQLTLGGRTQAAPFTSQVIVGGTTGVSAVTPQTVSGTTYAFASWSDGGAQTHNITAGTSPVTYTATYTGTPAGACPVGQYRAEYFPNRTVTGAPASTACEAAPLDRNWGTRGPAGVGQNNFSARWTGSIDFPTAATGLAFASDDGVRVWVDDRLVLDRWATASSGNVAVSVTAGTHRIRVEYYEKTGSAFVRLGWT